MTFKEQFGRSTISQRNTLKKAHKAACDSLEILAATMEDVLDNDESHSRNVLTEIYYITKAQHELSQTIIINHL